MTQQENSSNRLRPVSEDLVDEDPKPGVEFQVLLLLLKTLSQKTIIALHGLWSSAAVASAFWLYYAVRANPTVTQLILAGLYGTFVLIAIFLKRR